MAVDAVGDDGEEEDGDEEADAGNHHEDAVRNHVHDEAAADGEADAANG